MGDTSRVNNFAATRTVRISGNTLLTLTMGSDSGTFRYEQFDISPATLSSRLATLSDAFLAYRFTRFRFRVYGQPSDTAPFFTAVGYVPVVPDAPPLYISDIAEMQSACILSGPNAPPPMLDILRRGMNGLLTKWLKTRPTAVDDTFEYQGSIVAGCINAFATHSVYLFIEYSVEFKDPAPTNLTSFIRDPVPAATPVVSGWPVRDDDEKSVVHVQKPKPKRV
jgi:hypothetical protein